LLLAEIDIMSSTDRDGGQAKSRRNTFQRMLDMERKNKVCEEGNKCARYLAR
jgi:hypothetical protein